MLRSGLRSAVRPALTPALNKFKAVALATRWALNFNGVNTFGRLQFKAINMENDNTLEFWSPQSLATSQAIIAQNIAGTGAAMEFRLYVGGAGSLELTYGGATTVIFTIAQGFNPATRYGLSLVGTTATIFVNGINGNQVRQTSFTRGGVREPLATTLISTRGNGAGSFLNFYSGLQYDVKINGTLWPITEKNQLIQLPVPDGLGAELVNQSAHLNPAFKGSQWTHLGDGRWQYLGDGLGELVLFSSSNLPDSCMIEYEVESITLISGTGSMRISPTAANFFGDRLFDSIGKKRAYYTAKPNSISFTRNNAGSIFNCIIKNISFKPLLVEDAANISITRVGNWIINSATTVLATGAGKVTEDLMVVGGETYSIKPIGGSANRSRWQYQSSIDNQWYWGGELIAGMSEGFAIFIVPINCRSIRIYFAFDTATATGLDIRKISSFCNPLAISNSVTEQWQQVPV